MDLNTQAAIRSDVYTPDRLIADDADSIIGKGITLITGQNLQRGAVLGKITVGTATSAAKSGGNTGNGTLTLDATTPVRQGAKTGVYQVRFKVAATNNGTFEVLDPDGFSLGQAVMSGGAYAFDNDIKFAVADGATDFVVGDGFDITVAAASGKYTLAVAAAFDGSQVPSVVLAQDCDATSADAAGIAYFSGTFNSSALILGAGHTVASVSPALRGVGINIVDVIGGV